MALLVQIEVKGLAEARKAFAGAEGVIRSSLFRALKTSSNLILGKAVTNLRNKAWDTGRLAGSLEANVSESSLSAHVGTRLKYGIFVHQGTRPHWPPISAITPWARRHKIDPFIVARAIARRGTKAVPYLEDAVNSGFNQIKGSIFPEEISRALDTIRANIK